MFKQNLFLPLQFYRRNSFYVTKVVSLKVRQNNKQNKWINVIQYMVKQNEKENLKMNLKSSF